MKRSPAARAAAVLALLAGTALLEGTAWAARRMGGLKEAIDVAMKDQAQIIREITPLLDAGADVNGRPSDPGGPLAAAACQGYDSVLQLLIDRGADVNIATNGQGWTALHCAAANGHFSSAKLLLSHGAKCCEDSATGTPAETAAKYEKPGLVRLLESAAKGTSPATAGEPVAKAADARTRQVYAQPLSRVHDAVAEVMAHYSESGFTIDESPTRFTAEPNVKYMQPEMAVELEAEGDSTAVTVRARGKDLTEETLRAVEKEVIYKTGRALAAVPTPAAVPAAASTRSAGEARDQLAQPSYHIAERPDDLAVVVGVESYSEIQTRAPYAERDADAFKAHVRALGVPERNVVLLKGSKAGRASLVKNIEQWLPRMVKPDSRVYFYFSGHGAPDLKTGQAYLVPWDGDPNFLESTAYPVALLYKKLGELPAKQVLVAMDSCFSGAGGRSVLASGARPLVSKIDTGAVPAKLTVLAASAASEISGSLDDKGHGAFTYFLLQGLDAGKRTPKALVEYLTPRVQDEARRLNRDQTPQLLGDGDWPLR